MRRLDARSADVERAWARLDEERRQLQGILHELWAAVDQRESATYVDVGSRAEAERSAAAAGAAPVARAPDRGAELGEARRRGAAGSGPAPRRKKPLHTESAEDWEREWEREDEEQKLVDTAATSLAAEMQRLLHAFNAPSGKPARSKRDSMGRKAAGAARGSELSTGDRAVGVSPPESSLGSSSTDAPSKRPAEDAATGAAAHAGMGTAGGDPGPSVGGKLGAPGERRQPGRDDAGSEREDDDFNLVIEDVD
jgi:hypothetical protein